MKVKECANEAARQIKKLEREITSNKNKIETLKYDTAACRKAIKMWRRYATGKSLSNSKED